MKPKFFWILEAGNDHCHAAEEVAGRLQPPLRLDGSSEFSRTWLPSGSLLPDASCTPCTSTMIAGSTEKAELETGMGHVRDTMYLQSNNNAILMQY